MGKRSLSEWESNSRSTMKIRHLSQLKKMVLVLCVGAILNPAVQAQCLSNLATQTFDTVLTSNGYGNYILSFPQFNPDSGTLVSVRLSAMVNSNYGFTLRNADSMVTTYTVTVGQQDQIASPLLATPFSNVTSKAIGNYPLTPGQSVSETPFKFLSNHMSSD